MIQNYHMYTAVDVDVCFKMNNTSMSEQHVEKAVHDDVIKWKQFPRLLAICTGNSPVPGEFPAQRPVTRSFDVFFDRCLNKRLSKHS